MKKIVILLVLTLSVKPLFADCAEMGMQFLPSTKEISLNSMFIIEGYSFSQNIIKSFKERTVYLESENGELIKLDLQEILTGQMQLTQATFCPTSELKPNTKYFLKYADQTENEVGEMTTYNREKNESEKVYWITTDKKSIEQLNNNLTLEFEKTNFVYYGCGPEASAIFKIKNKPESEIWYKTEVLETETNKKSVYYIKEWNGTLNVGHDMCSGAFKFKRKGKYKVRFTPMNIDGNSLKTTEWTTFESPFMNDKSSFGY